MTTSPQFRSPWTTSAGIMSAAGRLRLLLLPLLAACWLAPPAAAELSPKEIKGELDAAGELLTDGKPGKAAAKLAVAAEALTELAGKDKVASGVRQLVERCKALRDEVELEGVDVAAIELPSLKSLGGKPAGTAPAATPAAGKPVAGKPGTPARPAAKPAEGFTAQVAPILSRHCGGCHIAGKRGNFQMASYAELMKTGVVQPGVGEASRLVEVILSGDMPRGGGKVSPEDTGILIRWINAGAPFDGTDPTAPIDVLARAATAGPAAPPPTATQVAKLKPGEVSFAGSIAPVLAEHCVGCHDARQPEANLSMVSLERLLRGGRGGAPVVSGKGAESLLVKKLKGAGIDGQRMPLGKDPLPAETIAAIQTWIDQGMKLDMLSAKDDMQTMASAGRARHMDHAALREVRFKAGRQQWTKALPDEKPVVEERGDLLIVGNLNAARLAKLADQAGEVGKRLQGEIAGGERPLVKGGVVVYPLAKGYDLSSFWQETRGEEKPRGAMADAGATGDVVYAAFVAPSGDAADSEADAVALLTEQITIAALAGRQVPAWFARGAGRALAMRAAPKAVAVQAWKKEQPLAMQRMGSPADFLAGHGDAATAAVVGGAFVGSLLPGSGRLEQLVAQLDQGVPFDAAFMAVFRAPPQKLYEAWVAQAGRNGRR